MSADNWTICPKCAAEYREKMFLIEDLEEPISEALLEERIGRKMREDYWIYTDYYGAFKIKYSCYCYNCSFSFKHKYEQNVLELLNVGVE